MNFYGENAKSRVNCCVCYYCNELFDNYSAYDNHLSTYHGEKTARMSLDSPTLFSNSSTTTRIHANVVPSTQNRSFIGGANSNVSCVANRLTGPPGFPNPDFSNAATPVHLSKSFKGNLGNKSSSSGNCLSSGPYYLNESYNEVFRTNTNTVHDGSRQLYNPNSSAASPCLSDSRRVPGSRSNSVMGMSASNRYKASTFLPFEVEAPQAKELPLLMILERSLNEQPSSSSVMVEDNADLDLSLHL